MSNRLVPPSILNSPWQASSRVRGAVQHQFHFGTLCLNILVVETLNPAVPGDVRFSLKATELLRAAK